jgi:cytochrome b561
LAAWFGRQPEPISSLCKLRCIQSGQGLGKTEVKSLQNSKTTYGIVAQVLHWLLACFILMQFILGLYAASLPLSMARLQWLSTHKSVGMTLLAFIVLRALWRWRDPPPPLPDAMPRWEQQAARFAHLALYLVPLLAILSGWLYASATGLSVNWFGLVLIPDLIDKNSQLAPTLKAVHFSFVALLALLILAHVAAALRHALILKDGMISRMLPFDAARKN